MDIRLARILAERGSNHPAAVALRRLMAASRQARIGRGRVGRIKYKEPRDLARLPRNPAEKEARLDLSLNLEVRLRVAEQPKYIIAVTKGQLEMQLRWIKANEEYERAKHYAKYYEEFFRAQ